MKASRSLYRSLLPLGLLSLALMAGCQKVEPGEKFSAGSSGSSTTQVSLGKADYSGSLSEQEKNRVVASIDGEAIKMGDLYNEIGGNLFKLRTESANKERSVVRNGLDEMIDKKLIEKEAQARGMTAEQLLKQEVESKVPVASEEEMRQVFEANRRRLPPNATFEDHKEQIAEYMNGQKLGQARETFVSSLRSKAKVDVTLPCPDLPVAAVSADNDAMKGNKDAPVTIVEWSDYQCPFCKRNIDVMKQVQETYGDKVSIVFRDFPLPFHEKAQKASEAAECAGEQGKYWEFHDKLFADQGALDIDGLKKTAVELGLDAAKFNSCLDSGKFKAEVEKDMADGKLVGVTGTPASFINGKMINGAQPFEAYKDLIECELAKAGKPGAATTANQ